MSEISLDDPPSHVPGQPPLPARPPVQNISVWLEKYSIMAALLATRFPHEVPEPLPTRRRSLRLRGTLTTTAGSDTTAAIGARRSPRRTSTRPSPMPASIVRPSRVRHGQCQDARTAKMHVLPPRGPRGPGVPTESSPPLVWLGPGPTHGLPRTTAAVLAPPLSVIGVPPVQRWVVQADDIASCCYEHSCLDCGGRIPAYTVPVVDKRDRTGPRGGQKGSYWPRSPIQPQRTPLGHPFPSQGHHY